MGNKLTNLLAQDGILLHFNYTAIVLLLPYPLDIVVMHGSLPASNHSSCAASNRVSMPVPHACILLQATPYLESRVDKLNFLLHLYKNHVGLSKGERVMIFAQRKQNGAPNLKSYPLSTQCRTRYILYFIFAHIIYCSV